METLTVDDAIKTATAIEATNTAVDKLEEDNHETKDNNGTEDQPTSAYRIQAQDQQRQRGDANSRQTQGQHQDVDASVVADSTMKSKKCW